MKYLEIPIDEKKLIVSQWDPMEENFEKKIVGWKGNMLSIGDWVTLVNACLSSISLYMLLSFLEAPKGFTFFEYYLKGLLKKQICIDKGWCGMRLIKKEISSELTLCAYWSRSA
jgi:hypothetical protein